MARKTNYAFEKNSKAKAKAEKREAKRLAKLAAKTPAEPGDTKPEADETGTGSTPATGSPARPHDADG